MASQLAEFRAAPMPGRPAPAPAAAAAPKQDATPNVLADLAKLIREARQIGEPMPVQSAPSAQAKPAGAATAIPGRKPM